MKAYQRVVVFEQNGSGRSKIQGIRDHGAEDIELTIVSIDHPLPEIIDDSSAYLPDKIDADLVLNFLKHPDLAYDLSNLCLQLGIPVVASGKKFRIQGTHIPPT